jgi:hypothetical protein
MPSITSGVSNEAIAGGIGGGLAIVVLGVIAWILWERRVRRSSEQSASGYKYTRQGQARIDPFVAPSGPGMETSSSHSQPQMERSVRPDSVEETKWEAVTGKRKMKNKYSPLPQ